MAQQEKALAIKPEDLGLIARSHRVEAGHRLLQVVL